MPQEQEITFYRFMSEMKGFLGRLLKDPIGAQPSNFLKELGFSKSRIINVLMKKDILERNEKILTPDKTGEEKVKYAVIYKVRRKDFERKMKRLYSRYFEKNLPEKQETFQQSFPEKSTALEECDGGAAGDAGAFGGATSAMNSGQYVAPLGDVQRRKTVYMTEAQIKYIKNYYNKKKDEITSSLWENFEHYLNISIDSATNNRSLRLLAESDHYSTVPNAWKIWSTVANYCQEYIKNEEPTDYGNYGKGYIINLPEDIIDFSFWEKLNCRIILIDKATVGNLFKHQILDQNKYIPNYGGTDEQQKKYIKSHGKMERVRFDVANVSSIDNLINDELRTSFFHELMHAYEDYTRYLKGSDSMENYKEKTNYYDAFKNRKYTGEFGWQETNLLKNLFHFFNKTEIRAMISEFSGEILNHNDVGKLTGVLDNTKDVIESTSAWKKIEDAEQVVTLLNNVTDDKLKTQLLEIYNKHLVRGYVNSYDGMLKMINRHYWNIKQQMFKKFSKIMYDIYNNNNKHISI